jgi:hypothetical protein
MSVFVPLSSLPLAAFDLSYADSTFAEFRYLRFEPDETTNDQPDQNRDHPREIRLSFKPAAPTTYSCDAEVSRKLVEDNLSIVYSQEDYANTKSLSSSVQDFSLEKRARDTVFRSARLRGITGNPTDVSMKLSKKVSKYVNPSSVQYAASVKPDTTKQIKGRTVISGGKYIFARSVASQSNVLSRFAAVSGRATSLAGVPGPNFAMHARLKQLKSEQDRSNAERLFFSQNDFDALVESVYERESDIGEIGKKAELRAHVIVRQEIHKNGNVTQKDVAILSRDSFSWVDTGVKYGASYSYFVKAVYTVEIATYTELGENVIATLLLAASPSSGYTVACYETNPPEPPEDFQIRWNYDTQTPALTWNFPVDKTRDVKYFQIFRRSSVNEPFALLQEIDFNDANIIPVRSDRPDERFIKKVDFPLCVFHDKEFTKNSSFIYTLACVDAHGFVSNYSEQLRVKFNKMKNVMELELVSVANAPRPYPNIFMRGSLTMDAIKISNRNEVKVYFDPEYLKVVNRSGVDMKLLTTSTSGQYSLVIIDVDRAQSISVPLYVDDLRTNQQAS